jgi:hypothetical protein
VAENKIGKICKFLQKFRENKIEGKKKGRKKLHPSPVCVREGRRWNARLHATRSQRAGEAIILRTSEEILKPDF